MRYAVARYNQNQRDMAYRIYVTDTLRIISQNTAYGGDPYITKRWADIISEDHEEKKVDGNEIAANIIKKAGIEVI